jgi:hypothetical protein
MTVVPFCMSHTGALAERGVPKQLRKGFDTLIVLMAWCIWKGRNNRVFNSAMRHATQLAIWIMEEARSWVVAGFTHLLSNPVHVCVLRGPIIFSPEMCCCCVMLGFNSTTS